MLVGDDNIVTKFRIRSQQLLKTLQSVMGTSIVPDLSQSMLIARPFKALMSFNHQLKDKRAELEQELEDHKLHDSNAYLEGTIKPTEPSIPVELNKLITKRYLDILLQALTVDLAEDYEAYSSMRFGSGELVTFAHLWYLFQPGDTIIEGKGQSAQAYRVLRAHEKINKGSQNMTDSLPDTTSMFSINCLYIGYNGKTFGPVTKSFTIRHFHGKWSVASLPVIPIQYLKEDHMQERLVSRGSKFSSFSAPRHETYAGLTIDELPTEVGI